MSKVSIIIPSRNERFLPETLDDIFAHATGDIEVIVNLDGYWPDPPLAERPNLHLIHHSKAVGMRRGINMCAALARGDYIMKCDAHCSFAEGFDEVLAADCADDWLVIPRRRSLEAETWTLINKTPVDYCYLCFPYAQDEPGIHGRLWRERAKERIDIELDEDMAFQGSCWFMSKPHWDRVGPLQEAGYGTFIGEPQEIGLRTWLGGGKQMRNKKTWYAHLHKGKRWGRGYSVSRRGLRNGNAYSVDFWMNNRWTERVHDIEWLVEKFWPLPTWPGDRALWKL
jgi:glycosyltransferase involved in cell wall biosynthesis